jgi:hypothetical protein
MLLFQLLYITLHLSNKKDPFSLRGLWYSLTCFTTDTLDLLLLSLLRVGSLSGLSYYGSVIAAAEAVEKEKGKGSKLQSKLLSNAITSKVLHFNADAYTSNGNKSSLPNGNGKLENGSLKEPLLSRKDSVAVKAPTTFYQEWFAGSSRKDAVLLVVFLLCTGFQVHLCSHCYLSVSPSCFVPHLWWHTEMTTALLLRLAGRNLSVTRLLSMCGVMIW